MTHPTTPQAAVSREEMHKLLQELEEYQRSMVLSVGAFVTSTVSAGRANFASALVDEFPALLSYIRSLEHQLQEAKDKWYDTGYAEGGANRDIDYIAAIEDETQYEGVITPHNVALYVKKLEAENARMREALKILIVVIDYENKKYVFDKKALDKALANAKEVIASLSPTEHE